MAFSQEDKIVIKFLRKNKHYGSKKFIRKFPDKGWTVSGLNKFLRKIDLTGSSERRAGKSCVRYLTFEFSDANDVIVTSIFMPETSYLNQCKIIISG